MKEKTFYKLLLEYNDNPAKAKNFLTDGRFTSHERKIVQAHLLTRDKKNQEVVDLLLLLTPSDLIFVESQRQLLLGCAFNNLSSFEEAQHHLLKSLELVGSLDVPYFKFVSLYNLFWVYANLTETEKMQSVLEKLDPYIDQGEKYFIRVQRCRLCFFEMKDMLTEASKALNEIEDSGIKLSESDMISFLVDKFMLLIKKDELHAAESVLTEMKKFRKYHLSENYNFMKLLLNHLLSGAPIYAYESDFKDCPLLLHQVMVIQHLEGRNIEEATKEWLHLQRISKKIFGPNFKYFGSKCLFSLCLERYKDVFTQTFDFELPSTGNKLERLITIFKQAQAPIAAAHLYELIWKEVPEGKEELKRVSRLVSRANLEKGMGIEYHKGTYSISKVKTTKRKIS